MAFAAPDVGPAPSSSPSVLGWIVAMIAVTVAYYQMPKARPYIGGFMALVMLGLVLRNYGTIRADVLKLKQS